jgi:hypothetical protein
MNIFHCPCRLADRYREHTASIFGAKLWLLGIGQFIEVTRTRLGRVGQSEVQMRSSRPLRGPAQGISEEEKMKTGLVRPRKCVIKIKSVKAEEIGRTVGLDSSSVSHHLTIHLCWGLTYQIYGGATHKTSIYNTTYVSATSSTKDKGGGDALCVKRKEGRK